MKFPITTNKTCAEVSYEFMTKIRNNEPINLAQIASMFAFAVDMPTEEEITKVRSNRRKRKKAINGRKRPHGYKRR